MPFDLRTFAGSAVLVCVVASAPAAQAQVGARNGEVDDQLRRVARVASGTIEGQVSDETGGALAGATVSALGATSAAAVTDARGRFALRLLPAGAYVIRTHLPGFLPSRRELVDVKPNGYARYAVSLRRAALTQASLAVGPADAPVAVTALETRGAGGVAGPDATATLAPATADRSETAWRLRHLTRNVLKDATERVAVDDGGEPSAGAPGLGQPAAGSRRLYGRGQDAVSNLFADLPLAGELNFLTSSALDRPRGLLAPEGLASGVTYVSLRGPAADHGDWAARLIIAPAGVGSYYVSGSYRSRSAGRHVLDAGASYSLLRYADNPATSSPATIWSRSAGSVYALDRWALSRYVNVAYGGEFSHYDNVAGIGLFSPRATVTVMPTSRMRIRTTLARRMVAPGADEFLPPMAETLWVPEPRSLETLPGGPATSVERVNHYEVAFERDWAGYVVAFRTFYQQVGDQHATMFGGAEAFPVNSPVELYTVASAGDLSTRGWSVGLSNALTSRLRGSVSYALTTSTWEGLRDGDEVIVLPIGRGLAGIVERNHDLTTQIETELPVTATRVFVVYRINTGFTREDAATFRPGLETRFDVQVVQRLPFLDFASAQWQVVFAVRNLFRDAGIDHSVYDELLVLRPPTRIVGGFSVRF